MNASVEKAINHQQGTDVSRDVTLVEAVNMALARAMENDDNVVVLGEDIATNGGVFRATVGLKERFGCDTKLPLDDIRDRLLFRMVVEAARCLDEGVVANVRDGNVGSILAFGFPVHTGGVFQFIESRGVDAFITRASELAEAYGPRFEMPKDFQSTLDRASASKLKVPA